MATLPRKYLLISPTPSLHILFRVSSSRIQVNLIGCVIQKRCTLKVSWKQYPFVKNVCLKLWSLAKLKWFFYFMLSSVLSLLLMCYISFQKFQVGWVWCYHHHHHHHHHQFHGVFPDVLVCVPWGFSCRNDQVGGIWNFGHFWACFELMTLCHIPLFIRAKARMELRRY